MQIYSRRHVTIVFHFEKKKKEDGEEKNLENEERKKEREIVCTIRAGMQTDSWVNN